MINTTTGMCIISLEDRGPPFSNTYYHTQTPSILEGDDASYPIISLRPLQETRRQLPE